ncbi:hypothetical protein [Marinobacter salarius]|uniref:hypothetical protein n=1 Tax=Marinobacter salarius TaxID=1420917 RepID=UPI003BAB5EFA
MIEYIDEATANTVTPDWSGSATATEISDALFKANVYLNNRSLQEFDEVPFAVQKAAVELAKLSLTESIFDDQSEFISSSSVSAGPVTTSKTYAVPLMQGTALNYVNALLAPYLIQGTAKDIVRTV